MPPRRTGNYSVKPISHCARGIRKMAYLASIFLCVWLNLSREFLGIQNNLKILGSADCVDRVISRNPFSKLLRLGNLAWDFWGVNFWFRDFLGFCWKP